MSTWGEGTRILVGKTETDDGQDGLDSVFPGDLFTFFVAAAIIGDSDFVDSEPCGAF